MTKDEQPKSVSRRDFLQTAVTLGGGLALAGCAPTLNQPNTNPESTPIIGGNLKISIPGQMGIFDPATHNKQEEAIVFCNIYETLTWITPDHNLEPMLAESWTASENLMTWTFNLLKGVKFHHGREMTSDDVVFTFKRILDPKTASAGMDTLNMIGDITAVDASTVKFDLKFAYVDLPSIFSDQRFAIVPKDVAQDLVSKPVGTGPFKFESFDPGGGDFVMVRNPDYHGPRPLLEKATLKLIPEIASRVVSLKNGETHVLWQVDFAVFDELKQSSGVKVREIPTESWDPLVMDVRKPPFSDPKVRQAIRYAIDKDELIKLSLFGHGVKVPFPLSPQNPLFPSDVPNIPLDITKAKQLLSDAGYPDGFKTPLYLGIGRPVRVAEGIAIAEMLKAINVQCDIQQMPLDKFFSDIEFKGEFYTDGWRGEPSTDSQIYSRFRTDGGWNVGHWSNAEADKLLDQSRQTASVDERRSLYSKLAQIVNEDGPYMIAWVANRSDAWRTEVLNFEPHPLNFLYLRDVGLRI